MNRRDLLTSAPTAAFLLFAAAALPTAARAQGAGAVRSISAMAMAPDGRLVVADWKGDALHALALPDAVAVPDASFNVMALDVVIAEAEGLGTERVKPTAVAFDTGANRALVAYAAGRGPDDPVRLAVVRADGSVETLDPSAMVAGTLPLGDAPPDARIWADTPARSLLVTSIVPHLREDGATELLVAGLANADFASTLRRVGYPFDDEDAVAATGVEMYHAVHNQTETRAPIRAMAVVDLAGEPTLLAAYTCTPLVTVPMKDLAPGASVRAKTIAELGFGNTPLGVVPFDIEYQGQTSRWVMIANAAKAADLISLDAIAAASAAPGISEPVAVPFETTKGVAGLQMPISNLVGLVDQSPQFLLALRRDPQAGDLELVSYRKGAFFRLSDFVNEYDIPGYEYGQDAFQQDYIRPFHAMMKGDEGFADLAR